MSTKVPSEFVLFQQEIDGALALAAAGDVTRASAESNQFDAENPDLQLDLIDAHSLLDRCMQISEEYAPPPRVVRSIHHFACTGGSLISKCLHAMPCVHLISEVHPLSRLHIPTGKQQFTPTDMVTAAYNAGLPNLNDLSLKIFESDVELMLEHSEKRGFYPVFRMHSHTDFCVGPEALNAQPLSYGRLSSFEHKKVVTVRDPVDSYASLVHNGWLHHEPTTFDEYCKRYLAFIEWFDDDEIFYYEDFVANPAKELKKICLRLQLPYAEFFQEYFDSRSISGDSGRKSRKICALPSRELSADLRHEVETSLNYDALIRRLPYKQ